MNLKHLTDETLLSETEKLVAKEREVLTAILHHLREIERRRLYSSLKFGSLYEYAVHRLGYSNDQAYRRISAARLLKELPDIEEKISSGVVTLTHLNLAQTLFNKEKKMAQEFSKEKKLEILEKLENTSSREAEKIVLSLSSNPLALKTDRVRLVSDEWVEVKFMAPQKLQTQIEKLKGLLAHSNPQITMAELIEKLCELGIKEWDPAQKVRHVRSKTHVSSEASTAQSANQAIATATKPFSVSFAASRETKTIPINIRREVWRRDQSCCRQCGSTFALEIDHVRPRALGGSDESSNLRLLCRSCNQRAAIGAFGADKMERYLGG